MLQEWADLVDAWLEGKDRTPILHPPSMQLIASDGVVLPAASVRTS
jgi:hypothetical protein